MTPRILSLSSTLQLCIQSSDWSVAVLFGLLPFSLPRLSPPPGTCGEKEVRGRLDLSGASGPADGSGQLVYGLCQRQKPSGFVQPPPCSAKAV